MPSGPRTGYSHSKCYARELGDCSETITREHYISENILKLLNVTEVAGAAWHADPDELVPASPRWLASKMLCDRHNSALSPLDSEAGRFIDTLLRFDHALRDSAPPVTTEDVTCNGADIERWMLKVLVGMAYGGAFKTAEIRHDAPVVPTLFGERNWPAGWGLSVVPSSSPIWGHQGFEVVTHVHEDRIWGARFAIGGVLLDFSLGRPDPPAQRRPAGLALDRSDQSPAKTITLSWPERPASPYQRFTRIAQYDGPRPQDAHLTRVDRVRPPIGGESGD